MYELDAGGEVNVAGTVVIAELGSGKRQHGPDSFSAGGDKVAGKLRDQRNTALHFLENDLINAFQVTPDKEFKPIQSFR